MEQILKVEGLCRDYGGGSLTRAVDHVDFTVEKGEFVGIMGPSGSGKTTLLNCISTIDSPTAGHIWVEGRDITALKQKELSRFRRERLGFVFQDCNLLDTLTAYENIALALTIRRTPPRRWTDWYGRRRRCWRSPPAWISTPTRCRGDSSSGWPPPGPSSPGPHPGRRAHRRPGLQVRQTAAGAVRGDEPAPAGHHFDGDP